MNDTYTIAKQIVKCKTICKSSCAGCAKRDIIQAALNNLTPVEQLEVDNLVFELCSRMSYNSSQGNRNKVNSKRSALVALVMAAVAVIIIAVNITKIGG